MRDFVTVLKGHGWPLTSGILALALIGVLVFFGVLGRTTEEPFSDGRIRLALTSTERDFVLAEMRGLLTASQAVLMAALEDDMEQVARSARAVGMADVREMPMEIRAPLLGKLPLGFKQLGFSVHQGMDAIALDAETLGDRDHTLRQLGELMGRCIACHAAYTVLSPINERRKAGG
ncbi:MAG: hypothetical protein EOM21_16900 [Gammaproteobacteria bacterium]|nr:hypothetical protein [Gammaproteobacteria bacterium]